MRAKRNLLLSANYWPGFTDLMASLLLLFIFLAFYQFFSTFDFWKILIIKAKQNELSEEFQKEFPREMADSSIFITTDGNLQRIAYSNRLLFGSGEVELTDPHYLNRSARIFKKIGQGVFEKIQVEGYTDSDPITSEELAVLGIKDNWDLSTARAVEVVHRLQHSFRIDPNLLSATGYSWYQSRSNKTTQDKQRNRKIEIVLVYTLSDLNLESISNSPTE
jgi:flagellar motor protein MotB